MLARLLLVALLAAAALLIGPGLFRGVSSEPVPQPPSLPVASLVGPSPGESPQAGAAASRQVTVNDRSTGQQVVADAAVRVAPTATAAPVDP